MTDEINLTDDPGKFLIYSSLNGETQVEVRMQDETVWLSQKA